MSLGTALPDGWGLAKRTPGAPLTDAELQQRRDAARARWEGVAQGAVAGAAVGAAAQLGRTAIERAQRIREAGSALRQARADAAAIPAQAKANIERYAETGRRVKAKASRQWPIPAAIPAERRKLKIKERRIQDFLERFRGENGKSFPVGPDGRAQFPRWFIEGGYLNRPGSVEAHLADEAFDTRMQLFRYEAMPKPGRDYRVPGAPEIGRVKGAGRRRPIEGIHGRDLPRIRAELRQDVSERVRDFSARQRATIPSKQAAIRASGIGQARRILASMPRVSGRSVAGAAAAAGALGALGAWAGSRPAEKVAPAPLAKAASRGAAALATRLASLFRSWGENPAAGAVGGGVNEAISPALEEFRAAADRIMGMGTDGPDTQAAPTGPDPRRDIAINFDSRNPRVEQLLSTYELDLIRNLTNQSREAVRTALQLGALTGASTESQARLIRQSIGLSPGQVLWVQSYRTQLERLDPKALGRNLRDARFDPTVRRAIADGKPLSAEQIDRMVDAYQRRTLAYRATSIARTEGIRAANMGALAQVRAMLEEDPNLTVEKTWLTADDDRVRHEHDQLNGKTVEGLDTPFTVKMGDGSTQQIRFPHDPLAPANLTVSCRCSLSWRLVPRADARREFMAEAV